MTGVMAASILSVSKRPLIKRALYHKPRRGIVMDVQCRANSATNSTSTGRLLDAFYDAVHARNLGTCTASTRNSKTSLKAPEGALRANLRPGSLGQ